MKGDPGLIGSADGGTHFLDEIGDEPRRTSSVICESREDDDPAGARLVLRRASLDQAGERVLLRALVLAFSQVSNDWSSGLSFRTTARSRTPVK